MQARPFKAKEIKKNLTNKHYQKLEKELFFVIRAFKELKKVYFNLNTNEKKIMELTLQNA